MEAFMTMLPGELGGYINITINTKPLLFKDEQKSKQKVTPQAHQQVIKAAFETIADKALQGKLKAGWGKINKSSDLRNNFYTAIANKTGLKEEEVKYKIKEFAKKNPENILQVAKDIAVQVEAKTGQNILKDITKAELVKLVANPSMSLISNLVGTQPAILNRHLANFILAKIASEMFQINITLREIDITFSYVFGGTVLEKWRMEANVSDKAPTIHLLQGFAVMAPVIGEGSPIDLKFYHIEPQEVLQQ